MRIFADNRTGEPFPARNTFRQNAVIIALIGLAYFLAHRVAFFFPDTAKVLAAVWPAGGIGLAALLLNPRRRWPAIITVMFAAGNAANLLAGRPLLNSVGFMTANVLESLAGAWVITRWCGDRLRFNRINEVLALIFTATAVNGCTACIGAGTAAFVSLNTFRSFWIGWWVADGLGILIVAPLIVSWCRLRKISFDMRRLMEGALFIVLWCSTAWLAFQSHIIPPSFSPHPYMFIALLAWPALRLSEKTVSLALVLLAAITISGTVMTEGPFTWSGDNLHLPDQLLLVQIYLFFAAITGLLLAASRAESRDAVISSQEDQALVRAVGDNLPNGMVYRAVRENNGAFRYLYISAGAEQLLGVSTDEILRDSNRIYRLIVKDDRPMVAAAAEISARDLSHFNVVARFNLPDGRLRWMQSISAPRRLPDGRTVWDGFQMDITEHKLAEQEHLAHLRYFESMDQVNRAIQGVNDPEQMMSNVLGAVLSIFDCDRVWLVYPCDLEASSWRTPMERTRPEYPGAHVRGGEVPMDTEALWAIRIVKDSAGPVSFGPGSEHPLPGSMTENYTIRSALLMAIYPKADKPYLFGLHQCSHPRIWTAEEKRLFQEIGRRLSDALTGLLMYINLQESENRYRRITEGLTDYQYSVFIENGLPVKTTQSPTCAIVTGYTVEEFVADPYLWIRMVAPEDRELVRERVKLILAGKDIPPIEHRILRKDGAVRWVCDTTIILKDASGRLLSYDGVIKDITDRKIAEEKISASLREKEVLLREIHHRVKNNMQVITSLLRMKSKKVRDPESLMAFQESQSRIFSMALIHERLYRSGDFTRIDMRDYAGTLFQEIFAMYGVNGKKIGYRLDIDGVYIGIDKAIPFGLVLNELITNAVKYAFPPKFTGAGEIAISIKAANGSIETVFEDNGAGIPETVDYKNMETTGLNLVRMIVEKQLRGNFTLFRESGTRFIIRIPSDNAAPPGD